MKTADTANSLKFYRLTGKSGPRKPVFSEVIKGSECTLIHYQEHWKESFREQFSYPATTVGLLLQPACEPMQVDTNSSSKMEVITKTVF